MQNIRGTGFIGVYNRAGKLIRDGVNNLLLRQPAQTQQLEHTGDKYLRYGSNDSFPLKLAKSIQDSVTASSCLNSFSKFVRGAGFSDADLKKMIVNRQGETLWDVHNKVSQAYSSFRGFAICVKYNALADIVEFYNVPFQYCRLGEPDAEGFISKIHYNPFFGTGEERTDQTVCYDVFNPDKTVVLSQIQQKGYKGQILYFGETTPLSPFYPMPVFASAMNWMMIEAAIALFHKENLDNGFFQSVILRIIGDPNAESTHPDDQEWDEENERFKSIKTMGERFNIEMQKFSGAERVGNIMVQWGQSKDEWPDVITFPTNANQELFTGLSSEAIDKICLAFNMPAILANVQKGASLGGDGNLIRVSVKLMQSRVKDDQINLQNTYEKILRNMVKPYTNEVVILNYNPYQELEPIDKNIWDALSTDEKRKYIKENTNYPILEDEVLPAPEQQNRILNALWSDYPEKAKQNAREALRLKDKMECGTKNGWQRTEQIANGMPISYKDVKRVYTFLNKNQWAENKLMNESCDTLLFQAWGGREMLEWAGQKIKSIEL